MENVYAVELSFKMQKQAVQINAESCKMQPMFGDNYYSLIMEHFSRENFFKLNK